MSPSPLLLRAAALCAALLLLPACLAHAPEPAAGADTMTVAGDRPGWPVTVLEDEWGIPHVYARDLNDGVFALGWLHAEDRLWQMEVSRRLGAGRLSEILGKRTLDADRFLRTVGFARAASQALHGLPEDELALLRAYADGVNASIAAMEELPPEFKLLRFEPEPWTPVDSLVQTKVMAWWLTGTASSDATFDWLVRELGRETADWIVPPYPGEGPRILPPDQMRRLRGHAVGLGGPRGGEAAPDGGAEVEGEVEVDHEGEGDNEAGDEEGGKVGDPPEEGSWLLRELVDGPAPGVGSNNWVVHGSRTDTGMPILANDPHLAVSVPSIWYLAEVHAGPMHVVGATLPGLPGMPIGHNEHIAWGVTNVGADVLDLYRERLDPEDPTRVQRGDGWETLQVVRETIVVKGRPRPVELDVRIGSRGPLVTGLYDGFEPGTEIALRWTALEAEDRTLSAWLGVMQASDWQGFLDALSLYVVPSQNVVYADRQGHIGWKVPGLIPIRQGWDGRTVGRGWAPEDDWQGWIPFEELPEAYDPLQGWIATANNHPAPDDYPHDLGSRFAAPHRAMRIVDLLEQGEGRSVEGNRRIQMDVLSAQTEELLPALLAVEPADETERAALELLRGWDGRYDVDSGGAAVFDAWMLEVARLIVRDRLDGDLWKRFRALDPVFLRGVLDGPASSLCAAPKSRKWPAVADCDELASLALGRAVRLLRKSLGKDPSAWRWGGLHSIRYHHPLAFTPGLKRKLDTVVESPGNNSTVNIGAWSQRSPFDHVHFASYRQVIDLADWSNSWWIHSPGQSGVWYRDHYRDLAEPYVGGELLPMLFGREAVEARTVRTRQLRR
jgi:penicillin G amidase